jgi:predicted DNA-binding transcriptional regulator AlpA
MLSNNYVVISKSELQAMLNDAVKSADPTPAVSTSPSNNQTNFLSIADMCKMFGVSRGTIGTWMKTGKLPFKKISRRVFFVLSEVLESIPSFDLKTVQTFQKSLQQGG